MWGESAIPAEEGADRRPRYAGIVIVLLLLPTGVFPGCWLRNSVSCSLLNDAASTSACARHVLLRRGGAELPSFSRGKETYAFRRGRAENADGLLIRCLLYWCSVSEQVLVMDW